MTKIVQRNFITGDNWLYYKIYTGTKTADFILVEIINAVANDLIQENIIDKWFFIRYSDPKHHLRVRFHCIDKSNLEIIMSKLLPYFNDLANQDLIWKVQTDTYQRELERYGENTIELSESLFFHDSILIVNALEIIGGEDDELRWLFALINIDNLLDNFEYSLENKLILFEHLKTGFGQEFGINKDLNKQIDFKYRNYRYQIEEIMTLRQKQDSEYYKITGILEDFNSQIKSLAHTILDYNNSNVLQINLNNLLISYIHMSMVRLFKSKNRMHEMIVYNFLYRYYKSCKARSIKTDAFL
ncbi:thiopeptide-type bacteriocin biosynthesis protein [Flavobacterium sp. N2038]|uniref:thiopeptide-type bacteriocin biosynthesis protein n=1 Tax=Flavobacterium sp. N2038 TaxID=2986829 RepID=UPI002225A637|nr:thiopeptide-type bacteriocin biosynthesis protein [Flavobacterium sp. N2038]